MTNIHQRLTHELSQPHIQIAASSLTKHLERIGADPLTKQMCESMLLALKDKNELVNVLYEENDRLNKLYTEGQGRVFP